MYYDGFWVYNSRRVLPYNNKNATRGEWERSQGERRGRREMGKQRRKSKREDERRRRSLEDSNISIGVDFEESGEAEEKSGGEKMKKGKRGRAVREGK